MYLLLFCENVILNGLDLDSTQTKTLKFEKMSHHVTHLQWLDAKENCQNTEITTTEM